MKHHYNHNEKLSPLRRAALKLYTAYRICALATADAKRSHFVGRMHRVATRFQLGGIPLDFLRAK